MLSELKPKECLCQSGKVLAIFALFIMCTASVAQNIEGSFDSKFKRYIKGEAYSGEAVLSDNLVVWKGERAYTQIVLWSSSDQTNLSYEVNDLSNGNQSIASSQVELMFSHDVLADREARTCGTYTAPRLDSVEISDALSFLSRTNMDADNPMKIWIRINVPANIQEGNYSGQMKVKRNGVEILNFDLNLEVLDKTLPAVSHWSFHLDLWQYPYQILKHYNNNHPDNLVTIWSDTHFEMLRPYYQLLADAGQKVVTAHILDGSQGQPAMVRWIKKINGDWEYDFSAFDKYVEYLESWGISKQINCFSPVGFSPDVIPYYNEESGTNKELSTPIAGTSYMERWDHFLSAFKLHLDAKSWFHKTVIYLDEVEVNVLEQVVEMIKTNNSNWKIGLAYFHPPSESVNNSVYDLSGILGASTTENRAGKISSFYTSCSQTQPNNYVTPENQPGEMSWMAWHALNQDLNAYLRWAYDYWTKDDPLDIRDGSHTSGDFSIVYRSSNELDAKVYSSYRLEHLRMGIQDYEKIKVVKAELESSTNPFDVEALDILNTLIEEFHENSGFRATSLVERGEEIINSIVRGDASYCKVLGEATSDIYTQWVDFGTAGQGIESTWKGEYPGAYSKFTGGIISFEPGETYTLTVENSSASVAATTRIWIDWNGDKDFEDEGEIIFSGGDSNVVSYTFPVNVPIWSKPGIIRMRIQLRGNNLEPVACGTVSGSSTRDFDIEIPDSYCTPITQYNKLYFLKNLSTTNCLENIEFEINNNHSQGGYLYETNSIAKINRNTHFKIEMENSDLSGCARTKVWIDWNKDNDFNDRGEEIADLGVTNSCENPLEYSVVSRVPSNAALGTVRMRVQLRDSYQNPPSSCVLDAVSETIDFDIIITDNPGQAGIPILISPLDGEDLTSINSLISWDNNYTPAESWRLKITSRGFEGLETIHYDESLEPNELSVQVSGLPDDGRMLQVQLFWLVDGEWSQISSVNRAMDRYCKVRGGKHLNYYIQRLNTTGADNNISYLIPGAPDNGYDYHRTSSVSVQEDSAFTVNLTPSPASNCARIKVWIDWNEDNDFDDRGEEVYNMGNVNSCENPYHHNFQVHVPSGSSGFKRMRIQLRDAWKSEPVNCGINDYTGTADFDINVTGNNSSGANLDYQSDFSTSAQFWTWSSSNGNGYTGIYQASNYNFPMQVLCLGRTTSGGEDPIVYSDLRIDLSTAFNDIILSYNHAAYGNPVTLLPDETGIYL